MEVFEDRANWEASFRAGWLAHYQGTGETDFKQYVRRKIVLHQPVERLICGGAGWY